MKSFLILHYFSRENVQNMLFYKWTIWKERSEMLLKNKGIRHIFYQEKATTKKKGSHLVALPFKVDVKVVFFE